MATREVLQQGREVRVDSKGNKTYGPMPTGETKSVSARTLGAGAAANAAQALINARSKRDEEAGSLVKLT